MTVNTEDSRSVQNGDGVSTAFTLGFPLLDDGDLLVYVGTVPQTLTTDYSVSILPDGSNGTVTFVVPPPPGTANVVLIRDPDQLQSTKYPPNDPFPAKSHETALDKLTMLVQRTRDLINRSFRFNDADTSGASLEVPSPVAGQVIGWNASGTGLANYAALAESIPIPVDTINGGTSGNYANFAALVAAIKALLGLGTAAALNAGTAVGNLVQMITGPKLPAVDGSLLTNLPIPRGALSGLTMSTAGSSTTMTVAAGQAVDSTNSIYINLAASISKTTAAWAVGSAAGGKAETGAAANNASYHFYEIRRPDTGVVDVCFSTSATGLTAGSYVAGGGNVADAYTQFRRIGSARTNGSAQWVKFVQNGDQFLLDTQSNDYSSANNPGTAAILIPLTSIPTGVKMQALFVEQCIYNNSFYYTLFTDPAQTDTTPSTTNFDFYYFNSAGGQKFGRPMQVGTDTSAQIRRRQDASGALDSFNINTVGWIDQRGKNV